MTTHHRGDPVALDRPTRERLLRAATTCLRFGHDDNLEGPWFLEPIHEDTPTAEANHLVRLLAWTAAHAQGEINDDRASVVSSNQLTALALFEAALRDDRADLETLTPKTVVELQLLVASLVGLTAGLLRAGWPGRETDGIDTLRRGVLERYTATNTPHKDDAP